MQMKIEEEFRKAKNSALWFATVSVILVISVYINLQQTESQKQISEIIVPTIGISINKDVLIGGLLLACIYSFANFIFLERKSKILNSQAVVRLRVDEIISGSVEKINKLLDQWSAQSVPHELSDITELRLRIEQSILSSKSRIGEIRASLLTEIESWDDNWGDSVRAKAPQSFHALTEHVISTLDTIGDAIYGIDMYTKQRLEELVSRTEDNIRNVNDVLDAKSVFSDLNKNLNRLSDSFDQYDRAQWHLVESTGPKAFMLAGVILPLMYLTWRFLFPLF